MTALKSKNIGYEVAEILTDRIIRMDYKPGDRILEVKVAKEFSVSQSSVREALRILESSGLVEINQRHGTYVTQLSLNDVDILYDLIEDIYSLLIRKAMEHKTPENIKRVVDVLNRIEIAADKNDVDGYFYSIFEFAIVAIEAVDSPLLKKIITDTWYNKRRVEYLTLKLRKNELKKNVKYFTLLQRYMVESNMEKLDKTIRDYVRNEKKIAMESLARVIKAG
ncbi:MAG: GntR family transcriptional regulator [Spirochaetes bacterium]|nr:GntR family transcriptional regulator [Spirochaetota bacterium]